MSLSPDAPRQTGRYAVVAGELVLARYIIGLPGVLVQVAPGDPLLSQFTRDFGTSYWTHQPPSDDALWTRMVPWDDVEHVYAVEVWWRLHGYPVVEWRREEQRVWVSTGDDAPYRRPRLRRPRGLQRADRTDGYEGWVDAAALVDRCEIEDEWNVEFLRTPVEDWDGLSRDPGPFLSKRARRAGAGDAWEVVDAVGSLLPW